MVNITEQILARRQTIIYGVKRGKIPTALRPCVPPQKKEAGSKKFYLKRFYTSHSQGFMQYLVGIYMKLENISQPKPLIYIKQEHT